MKKGVPKGARRLWAQCLIQAISAAVIFNSTASWEELYALPKCVLRAQERGGKGRNRGEVESKQLCRRWLEGQRATLWNCVRENRFASRNDTNSWAEVTSDISDQDTERILELVGMGLPRKACSVLNGQPPVAPTREVVDEMRTKHPAASQPISWEALRPVHGAAAPILDDDLVRKAIKSFPKDSGCGPCGLRPQHIRDAMVPGFEDELIRQLSALVNLLARGEAAPDARPFFCGATLVALRKEDATHRPIAVGETIRRLVSKSLAMGAKADARDILEPLQVGVGTPGGVEAVPHVCRKWFAMHSQDQNRV